jgi:hypothetical protein
MLREAFQGLLFKRRRLLLARQESIPLLISVPLAEKIKSAHQSRVAGRDH